MLLNIKAKITIKKKKWTPGKPFNPNFDGNLLAWYDGDTLTTDPANTWSDRSINGYDLTLVNAPTVINNAINGHDALQFDGINQYANRNATPVLNTPLSYYFVLKQISFVANNHFIVSAGINALKLIQGFGGSPNIDLNNGASITLNPQLNLNNYGIITGIYDNGVNSEIRNNNNAAVTGNAGNINGSGLYLGSYLIPSNFCNCEYAYLIIRSNKDTTTIQNLFINYLKNRFAL